MGLFKWGGHWILPKVVSIFLLIFIKFFISFYFILDSTFIDTIGQTPRWPASAS